MPTTIQFTTDKIAKARAKLKDEIMKEIAIEAGPAAPMDGPAFRFWRINKQKSAKVFNEIVDRWKFSSGFVPGVPGVWAVYSLAEWAEWTELPRRTLQRELAGLVALGLIQSEQHHFQGVAVYSFIRPTAMALKLADRANLIPRLGKPAAGTLGAVGGAVHGAVGGAVDLTTTSLSPSLALKKKEVSGETLAGIASDPDQNKGKVYEEGQKGKEEPPAPTTHAAPTATTVAEAWLDAMTERYPGKAMEAFTGKEWGQLKRIAEVCPDGSASAVVACIVADWVKFCERAMSREGASNCPHLPHIGFATKYVESAANFWATRQGLIWVDNHPALPTAAIDLKD